LRAASVMSDLGYYSMLVTMSPRACEAVSRSEGIASAKRASQPRRALAGQLQNNFSFPESSSLTL